jgi:outer membrane protein OmpA-like peptidoglycan-associated protein
MRTTWRWRSPNGVCRRSRDPQRSAWLILAALLLAAAPAAAEGSVDVDLGAIDGLSPPPAKSQGTIKLKRPQAPPAKSDKANSAEKSEPESVSPVPAPGTPTKRKASTGAAAAGNSPPASTPIDTPPANTPPASTSPGGSTIVLKPPGGASPPPAPSTPTMSPPPPLQTAKVPPKVDIPPPTVGADAKPTPPPAKAPRNASLALDGPVEGRILFSADAIALPDSAKDELSQLAKRLSADDHLYLQIVAYAGGGTDASEARRVSLSRALAARTYLVDQGVEIKQVDVRALGNRSDPSLPPDRVDLLVAQR